MPELPRKPHAEIQDQQKNGIRERLPEGLVLIVVIIVIVIIVVIIVQFHFDMAGRTFFLAAQQRRFILLIAHGEIEAVLCVEAHRFPVDGDLHALFRLGFGDLVLCPQQLIDGNAIHAG